MREIKMTSGELRVLLAKAYDLGNRGLKAADFDRLYECAQDIGKMAVQEIRMAEEGNAILFGSFEDLALELREVLRR